MQRCARKSQFQSTPAITGGRDHRYLADQVPASVSIHARHYWRARLRCRRLRRGLQAVSIHARHYWRARPAALRQNLTFHKFQSTPAITGGRDARPCRMSRCPTSFNPRPPLLAGETGRRGAGGAGGHVSIHARHYWRARLPVVMVGMEGMEFQSTPAITGGRDTWLPPVGQPGRCFNPRPPLLAGETASCSPCRLFDPFQSTPAITGGRDHPRAGFPASWASFNPRPPLLAGETKGTPMTQPSTDVSIHARHYWRARRFPTRWWHR